MDRAWARKLTLPFAAAGGLCLAAAAAACVTLDRGAIPARVGVACVLLALAGLALGLLRKEGADRERLLLLLLPVGAAMLVRALCLDYVSGDYQDFLAGWVDYFRDNGGFSAIAEPVGNYNVPYLYFLALISYLPIPDLYLIKLFSIAFDVILAWGGLRLVRAVRRRGADDPAPWAAFAVLLLLPTVVLNGAYWAQCDSVYGALTVLAAALVLEGRNKTSVALMAAAFSFKLQTVFVLPLWGVLWLAKRVKFRQLWVFPGVYLLTILPALLLGKPLGDILGIYFSQAAQYPRLTLNAPSVYQFLPYGTEDASGILSAAGIAAAAVLVLALLGVGLWQGRRLDRGQVLAVAVVLAIGVPFLLPHMHERYFFLADVLTVCWACVQARRAPAAVLVCGSSLASYVVYLRLKFNAVIYLGGNSYPMLLEALAMLAALVFSGAALARSLIRRRGEEERE